MNRKPLSSNDILLGMKVHDTITNFEGVVTSKTSFISGCDRVTVQPSVDKDGKIPDSFSFDWMTLEILDNHLAVVPAVQKERTRTGGPQPATPRRPY